MVENGKCFLPRPPLCHEDSLDVQPSVEHPDNSNKYASSMEEHATIHRAEAFHNNLL